MRLIPVNPLAENILGTMGTVLWTAQLTPQIWKSWREKSTAGLSPWLVLIWALSSPFLGVYTIIRNINIPLIVQPQTFCFLCMVSWCQCLHYDKKTSLLNSIILTTGILLLMGVAQACLIFAIRPYYNSTIPSQVEAAEHALQFFGIFSSVLISGALLPQFWEIYKRKEVVGISLWFMAVDLLGGVCNDLSLAFKPKFDITASIAYSMVVLLDGMVILLALILNPRAKQRRRNEARNSENVELGSLPASADRIEPALLEPGVSFPDLTSPPVPGGTPTPSKDSAEIHAGKYGAEPQSGKCSTEIRRIDVTVEVEEKVY